MKDGPLLNTPDYSTNTQQINLRHSEMRWCLNSESLIVYHIVMMVGRLGIDIKISSFLRLKTVKKTTIIVGLKSDYCSREMLLQLLTSVVKPGDDVLAVHVQVPNDTFDLNTFQMHEDVCKSKQVDFQVKVCIGDSYISELTHQVRVNYATILALGCSPSGPKETVVDNCLKRLPPTCSLLVLDSIGRILIQRRGNSQQVSIRVGLQTSLSSPSNHTRFNQSSPARQFRKALTMPSSSTSSSSTQQKKTTRLWVPEFMAQKLFRKLALPEAEDSCRHFTSEELSSATNSFSPAMVIGEGGDSKVYRAKLEDGSAAAVKVLAAHCSADDLFREVGILSGIKHEYIVQIIGYSDNKDMLAIVYSLLKGSLNQSLGQFKWRERMGVAIGVAKALEYLHHSCNPPIIHRDVKSSNILLSGNCRPQLSDFGAAMVLHQSQQPSANTKSCKVVGTFGYLAPEYMMYGKVDEKTDVHSFGVVLLELITGKEAIQTNQENHESLVLWARSLLSYGLRKRLIDPNLHEDYNKEEMEIMMIAARLCLLHSYSKRPTMKMILRLFEEPGYWLKMQKERDESLQIGLWKHDDPAINETVDDI